MEPIVIPPLYTVEQYVALRSAIAEGVRQVQYSDKMITYRSVDEMIRILELMKAELFPAAQPEKRGRNVGYYCSGK